ncbi:MAG: hypothetical protein NBV60_09010 [Erythrobacter sp.]|nr:hypothetical protein [Erythrobacter sp.]
MKTRALARFEEAIRQTDDVFVSRHLNREEYLVRLESSLRDSLCDPFELSAMVTEPGFEGLEEGSLVSGTCIAETNGYWLVYSQKRDTFLIFWGMQKGNLGAPGIEGSPLACWSA